VGYYLRVSVNNFEKPLAIIGLNTRHTHSSLSLASLQAFWERQAERPRLTRIDHDLNQGTDSLLSKLILLKPAMAAFSTYIWNLPQVLSVSGALKAAIPEVKIFLGGPEVSFDSEEILEKYPWIDIIIRGEGELSFEESLERFLENKDFCGVRGISHRSGSLIIREENRPPITNLDELPYPFTAGLYGKGMGFTYYEASRGCPFRCAYCLSSVLGPVRNFSLQRVFSDLDWFMRSEYSQVRFADRTFNYDIARAEAILRFILDNNVRNVKFHFELKPDLLSDSLIDLFAEAPEGLFHLEIGIQSTEAKALAEVKRKAAVSEAGEKLIKLREKTRCHIHLDLLAGLPGEEFRAFMKSLDDAFSWKSDTIQVGLVKVLKGTPLRNRVVSGEISVAPFPPYAVVRSQWLSALEIVRIQDIGKLVEGIFNPHRFSTSLEFLIQNLYQGKHSEFFQELSIFWRKSGRPFFSFGFDAVSEGLKDFLASKDVSENVRITFHAILLHEFRLNQKVPSGKQGPQPALPTSKEKTGLKLSPGLKVFWYENDPLRFQANPKAPIEPLASSPVIYLYQTDLSLSPKTEALNISLPERFVLALLEKVWDAQEFSCLWEASMRQKIPKENFQEIMDRICREGVILKTRILSQKVPK